MADQQQTGHTVAPEASAPALERGLAVIEMVAGAAHPVPFGDLHRRLALPRSSLIRLLAVLRRLDVLERDGDGYRPGGRLIRLRTGASLGERLRAAALPELTRLRDASGNTALCLQVDGETTIALAKAVHPAAVSMREPGSVALAEWDSPWGWILLAHCDPDRRKVLAERQRPDRNLRGIARRAMAAFRNSGIALDQGVWHPLVVRLAAPIYGANDELLALLALGGNPLTLPETSIPEASRHLLAACAAVTRRLEDHCHG